VYKRPPDTFSASQALARWRYGTGAGYRELDLLGPPVNNPASPFQLATTNALAFIVDAAERARVNEHGFGIGGATADATNGFAFFGTNVLFNSSTSIAQVFNKNGAANDAAFTFQQGFTTYAQFGLLGNNDFALKVGTGATTALVADEATGAVELTQHPKFSVYVNYDQYNAASAWFTVACNTADHNDQGAFDATTNNDFTAPHDGYYAFGAGIRHKTNGTVPSGIILGFSVNGANPTPNNQARTGEGSASIDDGTYVQITSLLKLSAGDTVELQAFFLTNDGYIDASFNYFWGHQVP